MERIQDKYCTMKRIQDKYGIATDCESMDNMYISYDGQLCDVLYVAEHIETGEDLVIYNHGGKVHAMPVTMFMGKVDIIDKDNNVIDQTPRFKRFTSVLNAMISK